MIMIPAGDVAAALAGVSCDLWSDGTCDGDSCVSKIDPRNTGKTIVMIPARYVLWECCGNPRSWCLAETLGSIVDP